jgi:phenylalanyl-tRNA synthetase alpha chain
MDDDLESLVGRAREQLAAVSDEAQLADAKAAFLGKSGAVTAMMKALGKLQGEE